MAVHALQFSVSAAKEVQLRISGLQHIKGVLQWLNHVALLFGQEFPLKYCLIHRPCSNVFIIYICITIQPIETCMCYTTGIFVCMYVISGKDGVNHQLHFS